MQDSKMNYELLKQGLASKMRNVVLAGLGALYLALNAPTFAQQLHSNGRTNGTSGAYFIDVYGVPNSFVPITTVGTTSLEVALWVDAGATPPTIDWTVGTSSLGSEAASGLLSGHLGYDAYGAKENAGSLTVPAGHTYWLTPTGVTDSFNSCGASEIGTWRAYHSLLGALPPESFTIKKMLLAIHD